MLILCIKIFFARIFDVTLGTVRTMFTVKGKRLIASLIGFIEVLIWFLVVREALNTESKSIFVAISYALGFATGTYIGGVAGYIHGKAKVANCYYNSDNNTGLSAIGENCEES